MSATDDSVRRDMVDRFVAGELEAFPRKAPADPKEVAAIAAASVQRIILYVKMLEHT